MLASSDSASFAIEESVGSDAIMSSFRGVCGGKVRDGGCAQVLIKDRCWNNRADIQNVDRTSALHFSSG